MTWSGALVDMSWDPKSLTIGRVPDLRVTWSRSNFYPPSGGTRQNSSWNIMVGLTTEFYEQMRHWLTSLSVDGDLVDETTPIGREEAGPDNLHVWGPPVPLTFLQ